MGHKSNWMAYSEDRWATAFCTHAMFRKSELEQHRKWQIEDYDDTSPYAMAKMEASVPVWWPGQCYNATNEDRKMYLHFIDPSSQDLSALFRGLKTNVQLVKYNATEDNKGGVVSHFGTRFTRELVGMPVLNNVSVGGPVTKIQPPKSKEDPLFKEFDKFTGRNYTGMNYTYESRFLESLIPLFVHYYYEVLHGPEYIHVYKKERFRDSLLCLGNLQASFSLPRPVVDKLAMDYMFSQRALPTDFDFAVFETPDESFTYDEYLIRDKMLSTPMDIGSVVRFFSVVSIVVNVNTSKEVRDPKRNPQVPTFAKRVANLFETLEDKTSSMHKENIALYGEKIYFFMCIFL